MQLELNNRLEQNQKVCRRSWTAGVLVITRWGFLWAGSSRTKLFFELQRITYLKFWRKCTVHSDPLNNHNSSSHIQLFYFPTNFQKLQSTTKLNLINICSNPNPTRYFKSSFKKPPNSFSSIKTVLKWLLFLLLSSVCSFFRYLVIPCVFPEESLSKIW